MSSPAAIMRRLKDERDAYQRILWYPQTRFAYRQRLRQAIAWRDKVLLQWEIGMPLHPGYPCPTCGQQRCTAHPRPAWRPRAHPIPRIRGRQLQALRMQLFAEQPFCQMCRVNVSTVRDHIVPLADGGTDDRANTQALCEPCNTAKAIRESVHGRKHRTGGW